MHKLIISVALALLVLSCSGCKKEVAITNVDVQFVDYFQMLGKPDSLEVTKISTGLLVQFPYFTRMYSEGLLSVKLEPNVFPQKLFDFVSDPVYQEIYDTVSVHFADLSKIETGLTDGIGRLETLFPSSGLKRVFWMVTGFNEPIAIGDDVVGVSLEHYLGPNHEFYNLLGVYNYLKIRKNPKRIPVDVLEGWLRTEVEQDPEKDKLLDAMIYEGALIYALHQCLPELKLQDILAYTDAQWQWSEKNEAAIWMQMAELKHVFSTEHDVLRQYIGEAPFTRFFGQNAAPQLGKYMGYKIVESYMNRFPETEIRVLIQQQNAQFVLQESRYKP